MCTSLFFWSFLSILVGFIWEVNNIKGFRAQNGVRMEGRRGVSFFFFWLSGCVFQINWNVGIVCFHEMMRVCVSVCGGCGKYAARP